MSSEADWSGATWEGSRRAQIRRNLRLTVRERLEALEALAETSRRLVRKSGRPVGSDSSAAVWRAVGQERERPIAGRVSKAAEGGAGASPRRSGRAPALSPRPVSCCRPAASC